MNTSRKAARKTRIQPVSRKEEKSRKTSGTRVSRSIQSNIELEKPVVVHPPPNKMKYTFLL